MRENKQPRKLLEFKAYSHEPYSDEHYEISLPLMAYHNQNAGEERVGTLLANALELASLQIAEGYKDKPEAVAARIFAALRDELDEAITKA